MNDRIWIKHKSVARWLDPRMWDDYLRRLEDAFDDKLLIFDSDDPARRKADTQRSEGEFAVDFAPGEQIRWLFGRFRSTRVEFTIKHCTTLDVWDNSIRISIPSKAFGHINETHVLNAFRAGNDFLSPFYSAADTKDRICASKPCGLTLDVSRELPGVFWATYFGKKYCEYFGEKLTSLPYFEQGPSGGGTLMLAKDPVSVEEGVPREIVNTLGKESFATGPAQKAPGQYAFTLKELAEDL